MTNDVPAVAINTRRGGLMDQDDGGTTDVVASSTAQSSTNVAQSDEPTHRRTMAPTIERLVLPLMLVAVMFVFTFLPATGDSFLTAANLRTVLSNQAVIGLAALAVVPSIASGYYDLSIGANVGASAMAAAGAARAGWPIPATLAIALLVGLLIGVINGTLVAYVHIDSLIATIGTSTIIGALVLWYSDSSTIIAPFPTFADHRSQLHLARDPQGGLVSGDRGRDRVLPARSHATWALFPGPRQQQGRSATYRPQRATTERRVARNHRTWRRRRRHCDRRPKRKCEPTDGARVHPRCPLGSFPGVDVHTTRPLQRPWHDHRGLLRRGDRQRADTRGSGILGEPSVQRFGTARRRRLVRRRSKRPPMIGAHL